MVDNSGAVSLFSPSTNNHWTAWFSRRGRQGFVNPSTCREFLDRRAGCSPCIVQGWVAGPKKRARIETPARSGVNDDGLIYPVAQFSHEGNNTTGSEAGNSAIAAGQFYDGFWAEELEGLYIFGNFSMDTLYYIETADILNDNRPADVYRLPLIDGAGNSISLASIIGVDSRHAATPQTSPNTSLAWPTTREACLAFLPSLPGLHHATQPRAV